jgi:hypothetical protein
MSKTRTFRDVVSTYVENASQNRERDRSARMVFSHIPEAAWTAEQFASSRLALFGWGVGRFHGSGPALCLYSRTSRGRATKKGVPYAPADAV